ncbi:NucA/NucB deoxyribonuclease domain-containing protein [Homoserinimonas sp. A447]
MNTLNKPRALLSIIGITALTFTAIGAASLPATADSTAPSAMVSQADNTAPPVFPTVPSDLDPNDGFTVDAVSVSSGQVLEPGQPVRIEELQSQPTRDCTPADRDGISICVGIGTPDPRAQVRPNDDNSMRSEGDMTTSSVLPLPSWCKSHGVDNTYWVNRFEQCGAFGGFVEVQERVNKTKWRTTGRMDFVMYNYIYTVRDNTTWGNQIEISPWSITGTAAGMTVSGSAACVWSCSNMLPGTTFLPQQPTLTTSAYGESYYTWLGGPDEVTKVKPQWSLYFDSAVGYSTIIRTGDPAYVRCDDALPGGPAGCAVPGYVTGTGYYSMSQFPTFGAHVAAAQASGLPGEYPNPLYRMVNPALQQLNRDTACPLDGSMPRPDINTNCDEYPFASTYQGAYTGGGTARTFDWCQITLPGESSTGALGYSVCMINAAENSKAGSDLQSKVFLPYRIIDRDQFYVTVTG